MTYSEKLKDPRWQKKRLKILERDDFACQNCDNKESTLHVHHLAYKTRPWEAQDGDLVTLCDECHDKIEASLKTLRKFSFAFFDQLNEVAELLESPDEQTILLELLDNFKNPDFVSLVIRLMGCLRAAGEAGFESGRKMASVA